ncbi:MAG: glutaredoxin family protein [bacterium]
MKPKLPIFFQDPFRRFLFLCLAALYAGLLLWGNGQTARPSLEKVEVHYFFHPQCPHCHAQAGFNQKLKERYPALRWVEHDLSRPGEAAIFWEMASRFGVNREAAGIPATFFGDFHFIGYEGAETTGKEIESALAGYGAGQEEKILPSQGAGRATDSAVQVPFLGRVDLRNYSLGTPAVLLGLIDGFNPCAMWVLVYLISLLATLQEKSKVWLLAGSFVFASGVLYFLFLSAWLNAFLVLGYLRPLTLLVGVFALGMGVINLREFFLSRGAPVCEVGDLESRNRTKGRVERIVVSPLNLAAVLGIVALAFVVNSIEFVCSAGIPAVFTHLLALTPLSPLRHYGYLLLYDFFFMLDDLVIFGMAAFAVQSRWGERYSRWGRLVGGAILLVLGILLALFPHLLR